MITTTRNKPRSLWALIAATSLAVVCTIAGTMPANAAEKPIDKNLPIVETLISSEQLSRLGASQSLEDIQGVINLATAEQRVQILINGETGEYEAAVLVKNGPDFTKYDAAIDISESSSPSFSGSVQPLAGVYACSTSGAKGISRHVAPDRTIGWCGSGNWSGSGFGGWYQYSSNISTASLVGPDVWSWVLCPGDTTCNISPASTLGFVEFS